MSDEDSIRRFMEMALGDVWCLKVIREWYDDDIEVEFSNEFLDLVKRMEDREDKEEEEPVGIQPDAVNPYLLGQEKEQEGVTVQPFEVRFFYCFLSK